MNHFDRDPRIPVQTRPLRAFYFGLAVALVLTVILFGTGVLVWMAL